MFNRIRNNIFESSVASVLEKYLRIQEKVGLLDFPDTNGKSSELHSLIMVSQFKKMSPSFFNDPNLRPNKVALATRVPHKL